MADGRQVRRAVRVEGIVQGVGFRPFVYNLARRLSLGGQVANDSLGVTIEVEGPIEQVESFLSQLRASPPPLSRVESIAHRDVALCGETTFRIAESQRGTQRATLISPDVATCADCLRELDDAADRRAGYPFINCTHCGPRFTIVMDVPYDRRFTTMAPFPMCEACAREYHDPTDRRFHAQPVACPCCGPRVRLESEPDADDPIARAAARLRQGQVVAVKGLGGYHLAADATSESACAALRARKHREEKPFALMVADVAAARAIAHVDAAEAALLGSPARPIVLLRRNGQGCIASAVAPNNTCLGVMLAYTPLHHLLTRAVGAPLVMTSGNRSDEPIAYREDDARRRLRAIADDFLTHDRAIHVRTDDSVSRVFRGRPLPIRRSRGAVPGPIRLPRPLVRPVLACGGELKNTISVGRGSHVILSHHIGDLENLAAYESFREAIVHFTRMFDVAPAVVACDLHPEYLSTKWALDQHDLPVVGVAHHHAHIAACLVDNGEVGPAIGVAFDGHGYGTDGTLWGGEVLIADLEEFERFAHLRVMPMPGGVHAIREPWRMAAVWLEAAVGDAAALPVYRRHAAMWNDLLKISRSSLAPRTSSMGRLFDALAAMLDVRDTVRYEGQAAIELEQLVDERETGAYPLDAMLDGLDLVRGVVEDIAHGVDRARIAARIHRTVSEQIRAACRAAREARALDTVALSGGVFQNMFLLRLAVEGLEADGFRVLWHRQVPCNDGGLSLGQAVVAGRIVAHSTPVAE